MHACFFRRRRFPSISLHCQDRATRGGAAVSSAMSSALSYFVSNEDELELPWTRSELPARRRSAPDGLVLFDRLLDLAQIDSETWL